MGLKQDFNVRRLEDQGRFLAKLILGKEEASYELPPYEEMDNDVDRLYRRILALADKGEINQAENELLESLEGPVRAEAEIDFQAVATEHGAGIFPVDRYKLPLTLYVDESRVRRILFTGKQADCHQKKHCGSEKSGHSYLLSKDLSTGYADMNAGCTDSVSIILVMVPLALDAAFAEYPWA